jgi:hypothetical protein
MGLQDADKLGHAGSIAIIAKSCSRVSLMYFLARPDALDEVGDKHHGMFSAGHMEAPQQRAKIKSVPNNLQDIVVSVSLRIRHWNSSKADALSLHGL